jgi:thiol-disulfide isomerase/thioredoxin
LKKYILLIFPALILIGCSGSNAIKDTAPVIIGKIEKNMLMSPVYPWFEKNYQEYSFKKEAIDSIKELKTADSILVFMGTWCGDSKREIPHFYKIMENSQINNYTIFGLDRKKKSPDGKDTLYNIKSVPTFIFYKGKKESGRIIEMPEKTLEEDILDILKKDK